MYRRHIFNSVMDALSDTPVVFLRGARQTGKSTLVREIANGPYPARYVTLDNAAVFSAAKLRTCIDIGPVRCKYIIT